MPGLILSSLTHYIACRIIGCEPWNRVLQKTGSMSLFIGGPGITYKPWLTLLRSLITYKKFETTAMGPVASNYPGPPSIGSMLSKLPVVFASRAPPPEFMSAIPCQVRQLSQQALGPSCPELPKVLNEGVYFKPAQEDLHDLKRLFYI